jgi:colicin import membrane protein
MMIRRHENPVAFKAGVLALAVHAILIAAMLISFSWKSTQPMSIAEVELWDALPIEEVVVKPLPKPLPEPLIKEEPKVEPKIEPKPEIKDEPKADIELEKKLKEDEKHKKQAELDKIKKQALLEEKLEKEKLVKEKQKDEALRKLQEELLADDTKTAKPATANTKASQTSSASAGEVDKYKAMIQAKIQRNVNKSLCGDGKPELSFDITLMPTGEVQGSPKLVKSSNMSACDDAVERAILQSQPLPLPADVNLRAQFRNIRLIFHPNE